MAEVKVVAQEKNGLTQVFLVDPATGREARTGKLIPSTNKAEVERHIREAKRACEQGGSHVTVKEV